MNDFFVVGLRFTLKIHHANNLKERRNVLRSLRDKLRRKFNISVLFNENNDNYRLCPVCLSYVVRERSGADRDSEMIMNFIENNFPVDIVDLNREIY